MIHFYHKYVLASFSYFYTESITQQSNFSHINPPTYCNEIATTLFQTMISFAHCFIYLKVYQKNFQETRSTALRKQSASQLEDLQKIYIRNVIIRIRAQGQDFAWSQNVSRQDRMPDYVCKSSGLP